MCSIQTTAMPRERTCRIVLDELVYLVLGEPARDLVEQQDLRVGRERPRELEPLALEQGQRPGERVRPAEQSAVVSSAAIAPAVGVSSERSRP